MYEKFHNTYVKKTYKFFVKGICCYCWHKKKSITACPKLIDESDTWRKNLEL